MRAGIVLRVAVLVVVVAAFGNDGLLSRIRRRHTPSEPFAPDGRGLVTVISTGVVVVAGIAGAKWKTIRTCADTENENRTQKGETVDVHQGGTASAGRPWAASIIMNRCTDVLPISFDLCFTRSTGSGSFVITPHNTVLQFSIQQFLVFAHEKSPPWSRTESVGVVSGLVSIRTLVSCLFSSTCSR